ncbi:unnamed protein product [Rhizophagus irregularis]|nr:unnamed protein product [Rhizophagus irregularis]
MVSCFFRCLDAWKILVVSRHMENLSLNIWTCGNLAASSGSLDVRLRWVSNSLDARPILGRIESWNFDSQFFWMCGFQ